jgi:predicted metalloprotease with PDZ domain
LAKAQAAPGNPPALKLEYRVRLERPNRHLIGIEITAANVTDPSLEFAMPAWSPGRYAIYDFAKNVQAFRATAGSGQRLDSVPVDKQTWRVDTRNAGGTVTVNYEVYGNDLNGSFSQFDSSHANLNGASVFMYVVGHKPDPIALKVDAAAGWKVISGYSLQPDQRVFQAPNYDRMIDTPLELSPEVQVRDFQAGGRTFRVAVHDYEPQQDPALGPKPDTSESALARLVEGLTKVVATQMSMMPAPDLDHYTFIIHFAPLLSNAGDGMEHLNSTQIIVRSDLETGIDEAIADAAHEFFHTWNVKRLRPEGLGPFDYTQEDYTPSLWFAEGLTQYYSYVTLLRAGIWDRATFLQHLAGEIKELETEPGRQLMSAESASFHAWYFDRAPQLQETNFANSTISYYNKGAVLGMLLDLEIRTRTRSAKSLDDVLHSMYHQYYEAAPASYYLPGRGYSEKDVLEALNSVSGSDFGEFFAKYIQGTAPLPYREVLDGAGLDLRVAAEANATPGLGILWRSADRGLVITVVRPNGAADRAGLSRGDLLISADDQSLATEEIGERLKIYQPGAQVPFEVERQGRRERITVKLDPPPADVFSIGERGDVRPEQAAVREAWLQRK